MIYIFQGIGTICKLPCTACQACCTCCDSCGRAIGGACAECCDAWRRFWEPIQNNPLGTYVLFTWVAMACAMGSAGWGLSKLGECDADTKGKLALFCIADLVLAAIHSAMAYYMQRRIVSGLGGKEYSQMTAKEIQAETGRILLYDVPVCLYFFVASAAFALNVWGLTVGWGSCGGSQPHWGAAFLMLMWGMCAGAYLMCWYCCQCCQGAASSVKRPAKGATADQPPTAVGVPAATAPPPETV